ncbi:MAG: sugar phosphate isomerase/epimerase, partial [Planctomycetaceae bacterium]|nr:sugar phosphate isomerase/epimerase [Planctomycetaceae bacterium]
IRYPLGLRLNTTCPIKDQIYDAARYGAQGVVLEATGVLAPHRLGETGRRGLRHLLRGLELSLVALSLPVRRPFDTTDQLDDRIRRGDAAFAMAHKLGTSLVLCRVGPLPSEEDKDRREAFTTALTSLAQRADYHGVRLAIETGSEPGEQLRRFLDAQRAPSLAASIDPASLLRAGIDPVDTTRQLGPWVAHAYAADATAPGAPAAANPRGFGYPPGALDWEEYLGALEEVYYHGFLTVWPDPSTHARQAYLAVVKRLEQLS